MSILSKLLAFLGFTYFYHVEDPKSIRAIRSFKTANKDVLDEIISLSYKLNNSETLDDFVVKIFKRDAFTSEDDSELSSHISSIIADDFLENLQKSRNEGWKFEYFIHEVEMIPNTLLVTCKMFYESGEVGDFLYNVVAIKRKGKSIFIWNMGEG